MNLLFLNLCQELSSKGGVLLLAQAVMHLDVSPLVTLSSSIVAAVSRLKSKVLSIVSPTDQWGLLLFLLLEAL